MGKEERSITRILYSKFTVFSLIWRYVIKRSFVSFLKYNLCILINLIIEFCDIDSKIIF